MSKLTFSKASAILVGLSVLATTVSPALAQNPIVRPALTAQTLKTTATSAATPRNQLLQQRLTIKNVEDQIAAMREKLASRAALLKTKLQAFKDQNKAMIAERVSTNLNQINQNQTTQMQKNLDTMSSILDKLEARVNLRAPEIKDPTTAQAAVASARSVIATASAAVSVQAQKDYTIQVTTETRIRTDAKSMRDKLHTDILATRKGVIDAKQAVANAIRTAVSGSLSGTEKEGTSSGRQ